MTFLLSFLFWASIVWVSAVSVISESDILKDDMEDKWKNEFVVRFGNKEKNEQSKVGKNRDYSELLWLSFILLLQLVCNINMVEDQRIM